MAASTFLSRIFAHAQQKPDAICFRFVSSRAPEQTRTWRDVVGGARRAGAMLVANGVRPGDIVALIGTHHPDLYAVWLGAVAAGAVPTILAEPSVRMDKAVYWARLDALLTRIDARALLHDPKVRLTSPPARAALAYDVVARGDGALLEPIVREEIDTLLLQHSSGTTGLQKGVMLSHGAVVAHADAYAAAIRMSGEDVVASWLPLYHDMGFIACFLSPLLLGARVSWLSPFEWVAAPRSLLDAIARDRATMCWLPNFAFSFLAQRVADDEMRADLSTLRHVVNCSEPLTAAAVDAFARRFASWGFDEQAIAGCYAMAENVFAMTTTAPGEPPRRSSSPDGRDVLHLSSGRAVPSCEIRIVDDGGRACPAGEPGRILVRSPFLFSGYFRRPDLNADLVDIDGFFDTGDLGWLDGAGHLYVTGRKKDILILAGKNVYPQDVEEAVCSVDAIHPGRCVAFACALAGQGTDGLVVVAESAVEDGERAAVAHRVRAAVASRLDVDASDVRIVERNVLLKSTSGKLARGSNREAYLAGRFGPPSALLDGPRAE